MERSNPEVLRFYKTKTWKNISALYKLSKHGICERCGGIGEIVHHKHYITSKNINEPEVTMNFDNLELLCRTCHNQEHFSSNDFDADGNIVQQKENILKLAGIF